MKSSLEIYYINLAKSKERNAYMVEQLDKTGLKYSRFDAIGIDNILIKNKEEGKLVNFYDEIKLSKNIEYEIFCNNKIKNKSNFIYKGWVIKPGEIGVWCSNQVLWRKFLKESKNDHLLIFEDDVKINHPEKFKEQLENFVNNLPKSYDIAYLFFIPYVGNKTKINDFVEKLDNNFGSYCVPAVIYSKKGIKKLLSCKKLNKHLDHFTSNKFFNVEGENCNFNKLESYYSPNNLVSLEAKFPSDIKQAYFDAKPNTISSYVLIIVIFIIAIMKLFIKKKK